MKPEIRKQRTPIRMRLAVDSHGTQYEVQEWRELVSVKELSGWSPWEPFNRHGEAMTCNGVELDRISSSEWSLGQPPVMLTLKD
ncbi:MAG: hypothetical protein WAW73_22680 [Rhodoferax sp.]